MLRMYACGLAGVLFAVGLAMTLRNWRHSQPFRGQGLGIMAAASFAFVAAFKAL